jgi:Zn-dependent protease
VDQLALGLIWYVAFLFSITFHEAGHAWAAMRGGDLTAYHGGQVTLDPRPHIQRDVIGTVVAPILSFFMTGFTIGWASTPYDPSWAYSFPKRAAWMSLAGPAANLVLVLVAGIWIRLGVASGAFEVPYSVGFSSLVVASESGLGDTIATFVSVLYSLNLLLLLFNLIPVPPLDGSGALALFINEDTARRIQVAITQSSFGMFGILIAWIIIRNVFGPVWSSSLGLLFAGVF